MPQYVIERDVPGAHNLTDAEIRQLARRSVEVLNELGPKIQWIQSYVTENKITCVYIAPNADVIREHANRGGFPANRVLEVMTIIDPTTAEVNELATV